MDSIDKLAEVFKDFPGIGERQARRFVYFLMSRNNGYTENIIKLISDLKKESKQCKECFRFYLGNTCEICTDPNIDKTLLMIIEKDSDLESVRKNRVYNGKYFILGGLVPIVEKTTKSRVRIEDLKNKVKNDKNLKEIILGFSMNPHGDHTDFYVRSELGPIIEKSGIKISSLGRGLSTGTELEYSDNDTLKNAFKNRQ